MSLFLSYSRFELTFTDSIFQELEQAGFQVWMDIYRLQPGQSWEQQIFDGLSAADTLLLVVSRHSMDSPNVQDEIAWAQSGGKRVILLIFEAYSLTTTNPDVDSDALRQCEWVDFRGPFDDALARLIALLKRGYQKPAAQPPEEGQKLPPAPRLLIWLARVPLVALVLLTLGFGIMLQQIWIVLVVLPSVVLLSLRFSGADIPGLGCLLRWFIPWGFWGIDKDLRKREYRYWRLFYKTLFNWSLWFVWAGPLAVNGLLAGLEQHTGIASDLAEAGSGAMILGAGLSAGSFLVMLGAFWLQVMVLGSTDMYRWAGPQGIPTERFAGWQQTLRIPILLMVLGVLIVIGFGDTLFQLLGGAVAFIGLLAVPTVMSLMRATQRYRRVREVAATDTALRVYLDHAEQDRGAARVMRRALLRHHTQAAFRKDADVIVTLLSKYHPKTSGDVRENQRLVPVLVRDSMAVLDSSMSQVQVMDWSDGVTSERAAQLAASLGDPGEMASVAKALPQKAFRADYDRQEVIVKRITTIVRGAFYVTVLLMVLFACAMIYAPKTNMVAVVLDLFTAPVIVGYLYWRVMGKAYRGPFDRAMFYGMTFGPPVLALVSVLFHDEAAHVIFLALLMFVWAVPLAWSYLDPGVRNMIKERQKIRHARIANRQKARF